MIKKISVITFTAFLLIVQCIPVVQAADPNKMGISNNTQVTVGDTFSVTVWVDGNDSIDGVKVNQMDWTANLLTANSVSSGYWDWLWDSGDINNTAGQLTGVQMGEQTGTTTNQTACTISFTADKTGTTTLLLTDTKTSSSGLDVPHVKYNSTVTIYPATGSFSAVAYTPYQINLTFAPGAGGGYSMVRGSQTTYPTSTSEGILIYNGPGTSYEHQNLNGSDTWYYSKWTYNISNSYYSLNYATQTATTPITTLGFTAASTTLDDTSSFTVWADCVENIDGLKIEYLNWTATMINVTSLNAGWWNWLWSYDTINNVTGCINDIQMGNTTTTDTNETAVNVNFTANTVGTVYLYLTQLSANAGATSADVTGYNSSFTIHPKNATISATVNGSYGINLSFSYGLGADQTMIRGSTSSYPATRTSGVLIYSGTASTYEHRNLNAEEKWYYSAFSYNSTHSLYSLNPAQANATTNTDNIPPTIGTPSPTNGSTGQSTSFTWVVQITDADADPFDYSIESSSGHTTSDTGASNGTKYLTLSSLDLATEYTVWVNVSDGTNWTREWFTFTTQSNGTSSGGGTQVIDLFVANDGTTQYDSIYFLIKLINPDTGEADTGERLDINIYVAYINGSIILNGTHPDELGSGLYTYTLTSLTEIGDFIAWATYSYSGTTYMDSALFKVKWNVYNNISRLYERLTDVTYVIRDDITQNSRMINFHLNQQDIKLYNMTTSVNEQTMRQQLTDTVIDEVFRIIISIIILIFVAVLGTFFFGQRRTRRLIRMLNPSNAAENIVYGSEPVYTKGRREQRNH